MNSLGVCQNYCLLVWLLGSWSWTKSHSHFTAESGGGCQWTTFGHCSFVSRAIIPQFLVQTYRTPSCAFTELLSIVKLLCFLPSFLWQIDNWVDKIRWHRKCMAITVNLQLEMLDIMFLLMTITTFMTITTLMTAARNAGRQCFSVTPGGQQVIFCSSALWSGFCTYSNCWIMAGISATVRIQTSTAIVTLYVRQIYVYT